MRHFIKDFMIENQIFVCFYTPGDGTCHMVVEDQKSCSTFYLKATLLTLSTKVTVL